MVNHAQDREAWEHARRIHQLEHASGITPTLPCDAVGHLPISDGYLHGFDDDQRRKFCIAAGREW